jgi:hypothetical protein
MIKFFRHIRKNLLETGKTGKYFKYAIGEIILVVIGILIAVQINTLIQDRQNSKLEKQYLERFIEDIQQDSLDMSQLTTTAAVNARVCFNVLQNLNSDISMYDSELYKIILDSVKFENGEVFYKGLNRSIDTEHFGSQLNKLNAFRGFDVTTTTINDLTANGRMGVIKNESLRKDIQKYYGNMRSHLDYQTLQVIPNRDYYNTLLKDLGILPINNLTIEEVRDLIQKDHRLITSIHYVLQANKSQFNWSRIRNKQIQEIKNKIKEELKKM